MAPIQRVLRSAFQLASLVLATRYCVGQTVLSLDSGSTLSAGSVILNLNVTSTVAPAGLQWTLSYPSADIVSVTMAEGPVAVASGKTISCNPAPASMTCVASGMNATTISNGTVAVVTMTLATAAVDSSIPVSIGGLVGALPDGTETPVSGTGAAISVVAANPVPVITSISPSTAVAGSAGVTLLVNGSGFVNGSVVNWNGSPRTTTFVSATQLQAAIPSTDLSTAGPAQVAVVNPVPGGGTSGNSVFTIANPAPAVTSLSPATVTSGGAAFTLTVNGSGFVNGSIVNWNGAPRTTTYLGGTQIHAAITASDILTAGTVQVTVTNPAGSGTSARVALTINNPLPTITALDPSTATVGGTAFTLTVNGSGFVNGSVVNWNGSARTTIFVNGTQLQAAIAATDIATSGTAQVTVYTPSPGGGTSPTYAFTITSPPPLLTSLTPSTATAGDAGFTLTVKGSGFVSGSVINWNGAPRSTTFKNPTQLQAVIASADLATAGTAQVTVSNVGGAAFAPTSISTSSNGLTFTITSATPGLTASYGFAEGIGTTTADGSGNGNTGQIRGATWTSGKYGNALRYDGVSSYVDLGNPAFLQSTGSMSWNAWVYLTAPPTGDGEIISRSDGNSGWELKATMAGGVTTFAVSVFKTGTGQAERLSAVRAALNTWYFVAGVYDPSRKALDIYVNGVLTNGTLQGKVPAAQTLFNANTTVGKNSGGGYFAGIIDELRVYTRALSTAEIQGDMATPVNPAPTATTAWLTAATPSVTTAPETIASSVSRAFVKGLSCSPKRVEAGGQTNCELRLDSISAARVQLRSSGDVKIPAEVFSRPNQSTLRFIASTDSGARQHWAIVTATLGESVVQERILVASSGHPVLRTPQKLAAKTGTPVSFRVSAIDPADLPVQLTASRLPEGASFDPATGRFEWKPTSSQSGTHHVTFAATNSLQQTSATEVVIDVDGGTPVLTSLKTLTCSPGAIAALEGRWLATSATVATDPSGRSLELGGTSVRVNGETVAVVQTSDALVKFVCPDLTAGAAIAVVVETEAGSSNAVAGVEQPATPRILTLDGSNNRQGLISFAGRPELAMERNYRIPAYPAQPGDLVTIWATGLGAETPHLSALSIKVGGLYAHVESIQQASDMAGVYAVQFRIPAAAVSGSDVPVQLEIAVPGGRWFISNEATLAIESVSR